MELITIRENIVYHKGFDVFYINLGLGFHKIKHTKRLYKQLAKLV
jgi:hypothetical protein